MKIGVIDVGSNSVRLMMWADGKTLYKRLKTTRLGAGLLKCGCLSEESIQKTCAAVKEFSQTAEKEGAQKVYAFATAAVRSAKNGGELLKRVCAECGIKIDVISGETEAEIGVLGALGAGDGGIIDVGGASSEATFRRGSKCEYVYSLNTGAVRLYDVAGRDKRKVLSAVNEAVSRYPDYAAEDLKVYAVGGTATTLAAVKLALKVYDPTKTHGCVLTRAEVSTLADGILSLSVEEVKALDGMEEGRADVIGGGAALLAAIMKKFNIEEVVVSESDNLEGYLIYKEKIL